MPAARLTSCLKALIVIVLEELCFPFSWVIRVRLIVQPLTKLGLFLIIQLVSAHHTIFIVFTFNLELVAAFLLLHVKAIFRDLVDKAVHPVDDSLLVHLDEPEKREEYLGRVNFEIKIKVGFHLGTRGLYFFLADLTEA